MQAGALDPVLGDHEVVVGLGADDHQRVVPGAAVDRDRRVDVVLDVVVAVAAVDVGLRGRRLGRMAASRKARTMNVLLPPSPKSLSVALLL